MKGDINVFDHCDHRLSLSNFIEESLSKNIKEQSISEILLPAFPEIYRSDRDILFENGLEETKNAIYIFYLTIFTVTLRMPDCECSHNG